MSAKFTARSHSREPADFPRTEDIRGERPALPDALVGFGFSVSREEGEVFGGEWYAFRSVCHYKLQVPE